MTHAEQALAHRLRSHVERLAGDIGERNVFVPDALRRAAAYIEDQWSALGYAVERQEYDVSGVRCANLAAAREGGARQSEILLLGAHYDSVIGCPDANDNASGIAALLEISRMFQAVEPALTVRFVAFVNEEPPFFMTPQQGSAVYAELRRAGLPELSAVVQLLLPRSRQLYRDRVGLPLESCDATARRRVPGALRFPAADRIDISVHSWSFMELTCP